MSPNDDDESATTAKLGLGDQHNQNQASRDIFDAGRDIQNDSRQHVEVHVYPPPGPGGAASKSEGGSRKEEPAVAPLNGQAGAGRVPDPGTGSHRTHRPRRPWLITTGVIGAAAVLLIGVLVVHATLTPSRAPVASPSARAPLTVIQLASSSTFFSDPNVEKELKRLGMVVRQSPIGSLQVCGERKLIKTFDISDSGSEEAASCVVSLVKEAGKVPDEAYPYEALMVIITYKPIVALLEQLGVASEVNGITVFDVAKYLKVFASGKRWTEIPGNTTYPNQNRILLWTSNPEESNAGGMLADIAYAAQTGGDAPTPTSSGPHDPHLQVIRNLFTALGSLKDNTPDLLNQILASGRGTYPMAMVYENQYLRAVLTGKAQDSSLTVMYPTPDVLPQDTLVAWTPAGEKLIDALQSPVLAADEEAYGYRTVEDEAGFVKYMAAKGITVPDLDDLEQTLQFSILPPENVLEKLINAVATSQPN